MSHPSVLELVPAKLLFFTVLVTEIDRLQEGPKFLEENGDSLAHKRIE